MLKYFETKKIQTKNHLHLPLSKDIAISFTYWRQKSRCSIFFTAHLSVLHGIKSFSKNLLTVFKASCHSVYILLAYCTTIVPHLFFFFNLNALVHFKLVTLLSLFIS